MRANLDMTNGLIFADVAATALAAKMGRSRAQEMVAKAAASVRETGRAAPQGARSRRAHPPHCSTAAFDLRPATAAAATAALSAVRQARPSNAT